MPYKGKGDETVHDEKKPYDCEHCHKGFDEEEHFKSHIETVHEGKKPYKCEHCHEKFDEEQNFKSY